MPMPHSNLSELNYMTKKMKKSKKEIVAIPHREHFEVGNINLFFLKVSVPGGGGVSQSVNIFLTRYDPSFKN